MARTKSTAKTAAPKIEKQEPEIEKVSFKLPAQKIQRFRIWIVGNTPLIVHAWSEKARREMLAKEMKQTSEGKEARDPEADFVNSLYEMGDGRYGFPAMAVKKALLSSAHKDKGAPRTVVRGALWINADLVSTRPALAGAICDMPMLRIYGGEPKMREDMVRVGAGLRKVATFAYRGQFWPWAMRVIGRLNTSDCPLAWLPFLVRHSGMATGIGDWRAEKDGMFGAYHFATQEEEIAWEAFAAGRGAMPQPKTEFDGDEDADFQEAAE